MKKERLLFIGMAIILFAFSSCSILNNGGPKPFEGVVTYSVTYSGDFDPSQKAQMPSEQKIYVKDSKRMTSIVSAMYSMKNIVDVSNNTGLLLIDMMGNQYFKKITEEDMKKALEDQPEITIDFVDETKEIAGYKCKMAEVTDADGNITVMYYTEDIEIENPNYGTPYDKIKGVLMEYSSEQNGITSTMTVKSIEETKVKAKEFAIPTGYVELTEEQAKQMFGGGM